MEVGVVILAAGGSSRMGQPKQLLRFSGTSLLRRAVEAAVDSDAAHCTVVLGAEASLCSAEIADLPAQQEFNSVWRHGISSSIRTGLLAACRDLPHMEAVIIAPCDQPFLSAAVLNSMMRSHEASTHSTIVAAYDSPDGIPALFGASWFTRLENLRRDQGPKMLFDLPESDLIAVPYPGGAFDLDTDVQHIAALQEWHSRTKSGRVILPPDRRS